MSSLKTLLQNTDPINHEVLPLDTERERIRRTILRTTPVERSTSSVRLRLMLIASLAITVIGVVAFGYYLWLHKPTSVYASVRFEVRLAEESPIPGLVVAQLAHSDRVIYLHPEIIVTNDDIAQSWVSQDDAGRFEVSVQFLSEGATRIKEATANHIGRPVAILIDGAVVMAPVVRSPIIDSAVISGNFTRTEAQRIADGIGRR